MSERTFKVTQPHMTGTDIAAWQDTLNRQMDTWKVDYRLEEDGDYGIVTRDLTASVAYGLGIEDVGEAMKNGLTPELRIKLRNKDLTLAELQRFEDRAGWRDDFRDRYANKDIAPPLIKVLADSWGYHPGVHDGMDLICPPESVIFAICTGTVIDVRSSGWWGKAPSGNVSLGDGIIQIECGVNVGPFQKGMHFGYGHAEHAIVKEGQKVQAGQALGHAGLAVAWHVHFMANMGGTTRGIGTKDPRPYYDYAMKNG